MANCFKAYLSAFVAPACLAFSEAVKTSGEEGLLLEEDFDEVDVEARGRVALPSLLAMSWQSLSTVIEINGSPVMYSRVAIENVRVSYSFCSRTRSKH